MSEIETVEIITPEVVEKPVDVSDVPTREDLRGKGWTKEELDAAEKRGMVKAIKKEEEKKEEDKSPAVDAKKVEEVKQEEKPKEPVRPSGIPEFTFKTPEQEKAWLEAFGPGTPQRGLYFRMKNERQARQAIEAERDQLKRELDLLSANKPKSENGKAGNQDELESLLTGGLEDISDEDKPLTLRQLKEMRQREEQEQRKAIEMQAVQRARLSEAHREHEEYARTVYPDFDDAIVRAKEVMQGVESFVPEKWKQAKVVRLMKDLQVAAANADKLGYDDLNAAHIAYEIASYHPDHGKAKSEKPEKANGSLSPEALKRIETNTQRRTSSASVAAGSAARTVSVEDIGVKELAAMTSTERWKFREKYPERYDRIARG